MQVIVFEDEKVAQLMPLVGLKPAFALFSGTMSLKERFETVVAGRVGLTWHLRRHIAPWFGESHPGALVNTVVDDDLLLLNGRLVCDERAIELVSGAGLQPGQGVTQAGNLVACRVKATDLVPAGELLPDLIDSHTLSGSMTCVESSGYTLIENIWDPVALHPDLMRRDRSRFRAGCREGEVHPSAVLINPDAISIGKGAVVMAGAVLDASEGYIHIGKGAVVEPQAVLMQNVVLAPGARAKICARIYSNVYVGSASKAGGEIEDSIIEPFANKQHDGFLGHSYISAWCNLGAATNTSDLKNNYSKVSLVVGGRQLPTGLQFLGLIMGEHSKSAIGSLFNTGTVVGTAANIFGAGMPPKYVPSFSWGNGLPVFEACRIDNVVETARRVMERRRIIMSPAYEEMFRKASMLEPATDAKL
jgi:UDP-N-acetylglucosamine diphosphorylase/glucosamine-1-phosphate N-acetyltransferase